MDHYDYDVDHKNGDLPEYISTSPGILADKQIHNSLENGYLLFPRTAMKESIRHASYQLRIGTHIEYLVLDELGDSHQGPYQKNHNFSEGDIFKINPGDTVKIFSYEKLNIPNNVVAHALPVGNLYELGLTPEVTYADPGYSDIFWIVVCNYSSRIVELEVGDRLARLQFTRLNSAPDKIHSGMQMIKKLARYPKKPSRISLEELSKKELQKIIKEIQNYDPPHYEHSFVTEQVNNEICKISKQVNFLKLNIYILIAFIGYFSYVHISPFLPTRITDIITNLGAAVITVAITTIAIFFRIDFVKTIRDYYNTI